PSVPNSFLAIARMGLAPTVGRSKGGPGAGAGSRLEEKVEAAVVDRHVGSAQEEARRQGELDGDAAAEGAGTAVGAALVGRRRDEALDVRAGHHAAEEVGDEVVR